MTDTPDPVGELACATCNWPEDEALENGHYQNTCAKCGQVFTGHKRRTTCRWCCVPDEVKEALSALQGQVRELEAENGELKYSDEIQRTTIATLRDALESICDTTRTLTAVRALEFQEIAKAALNPPTREALAREPNTPEKEENYSADWGPDEKFRWIGGCKVYRSYEDYCDD